MPRRDPAARREEVAAAVWRLIRRDGMEAVSVRRVAREAGLSTGSLRHLFATQSALVAFSMRLVLDRASARVRALPRPSEPRALVEALLGEVLPLDAERRAESEVWLAFCGRALVEPELRALRDELDGALAGLMRDMVEILAGACLTPAGADRDLEAERLGALIDGLALHAVAHPERLGPDRVRAVLARHLDGLAAEG